MGWCTTDGPDGRGDGDAGGGFVVVAGIRSASGSLRWLAQNQTSSQTRPRPDFEIRRPPRGKFKSD
jgi:hypothetical protein